MDCDGHLAQCLSEMNVDMTWWAHRWQRWPMSRWSREQPRCPALSRFNLFVEDTPWETLTHHQSTRTLTLCQISAPESKLVALFRRPQFCASILKHGLRFYVLCESWCFVATAFGRLTQLSTGDSSVFQTALQLTQLKFRSHIKS